HIKLSGVTAVVSYPGAAPQRAHRDHSRLYAEEGVSASLPNYAINVSIPLIDIDETTGPTAVCLGSHRWEKDREIGIEDLSAVEFRRGDCVLIDYRTLHMGMRNKSTVVRPILYLVYSRPWFFDETNHYERPSLDMAVEEFEKLPASVKPLVIRA